MDLPLIQTPVAPRWVWMEEITYSHIPIATYITAVMILAPIFEYYGWKRKDPRLDRLAYGLIWVAMILFSPGAALGTGIPIFIIGTYPEFWSRWANLFFWPLFAQFVFFLAEVGFLFFGYYLSWNALRNRKGLHIFFGAMAALCGLLVQFVWDSLGAYMMTPGGVALPGVDQPVAWSAAAMFNPSFPYLFTHRFFGNISYVMLLVGGVYALKYMKAKTPEDKDYFGFSSNLCFVIGFLAFFVMPIIGWGYARVIQREAPVAFHAIMGGHASPHFTVKMGLLCVMLLIAGAYVFSRYRSKAVRWTATAGLGVLYLITWIHPPLKWLGESTVLWHGACTVALGGFTAFLWTSRFDTEARRWRWLMLAAGGAAFFAFTLGGFVRERSRSPHTVYGEIIKPEVTQAEADRFLTYAKCLQCHHKTMKEFARAEAADWPVLLADDDHAEMALSEEQAAGVLRHLEEHY